PCQMRSIGWPTDRGLRRELGFFCNISLEIFRPRMIPASAERCGAGGFQMYAVIFEVEPEPARLQDYLDIAARLRPELERIDGFISVERFQSLTQPGKILSLSFWRDEAAVVRWRTQEQHRAAQRAGRTGIFHT